MMSRLRSRLRIAVGAVACVSVLFLSPQLIGASTPAISATESVARAVLAANAHQAIPRLLHPSITRIATDAVKLGACSAYKRQRSELCQMGFRSGTKTVVLFGNSHSAMWVPALSVAATNARWKFVPLVKEACGYEDYTTATTTHECAAWYRWALTQVQRLHPNLIVVGSYTNTPRWQIGERAVLVALRARAPRVVLLSDTPWNSIAISCFGRSDANQRKCLGTEPTSRVRAQHLTAAVATSAHAQYLDVTPWFCQRRLCPGVVNAIIPYYDGSHLTPEYSRFLGPSLGQALNFDGPNVVEP